MRPAAGFFQDLIQKVTAVNEELKIDETPEVKVDGGVSVDEYRNLLEVVANLVTGRFRREWVQVDLLNLSWRVDVPTVEVPAVPVGETPEEAPE
jgi:hypothetical protein